MSTVAKPHQRLGIILSAVVIVLVGLSFVVISTITAETARANLQAQLAASAKGTLEIQSMGKGWNWSQLKLRLGNTAMLCEVDLQHYWFNTWVTGKLYNASNSSIATFKGRIDPTIWNDTVFTYFDLALVAGQWSLPTGILKNGPVTVYAEINRTPKTYDFKVKTVATDLYYQGMPVLRINTLVQQANGSLNTATPDDMWWDAQLNLDAESDYGPLKVEAQLIGPNDVVALLQSGRIRIRTILPDGLWKLSEPWLPGFTEYLTKNGMMKSQGELRVTDALLQDGTWYAPSPARAKANTKSQLPIQPQPSP